MYIPTHPHIRHAPAVKIISVVHRMPLPTLPPPMQVTAQHLPLPLPLLPLADALTPPLETNSTASTQCTHPCHDRLHMQFHTAKHISKAQQGKYSCWLAFAHFTCLTDSAMTCRSPDNPPLFAPPVPEAPSAAITYIDPTFRFVQDIFSFSRITLSPLSDNPFPFPHSNSRHTDSVSCKFLVHLADPSLAHTCLTCSITCLLISPPKCSNLSCQQIILASDTDINESTQEG